MRMNRVSSGARAAEGEPGFLVRFVSKSRLAEPKFIESVKSTSFGVVGFRATDCKNKPEKMAVQVQCCWASTLEEVS
jgi:hypothetical protein